ncbi:MAG: transcription termination factor Rho [Acidimicrobiales bacterium]
MTAEQQLERSVLESKERDELHAIAQALSVKTTSRTKKADMFDGILRATGVVVDAVSNGGPDTLPPSGPPEGDASGPAARTAARKPRVSVVPDEETPGGNVHAGVNGSPVASESALQTPPGAALEPPGEPVITNGAVHADTRFADPGMPDERGDDRAQREQRGADAVRRDAGGPAGPNVGVGDSASRNGIATGGGRNQSQGNQSQGNQSQGNQSQGNQSQGNQSRSHGQGNQNRQGAGTDVDAGNRRNNRRRNRNRERQAGGERELQGGGAQEQQYQGELIPVRGLFDLRDEGYGFLRCDGYLPSAKDVYVSISQARRFSLRKGDYVEGACRPAGSTEKFPALLRIDSISGLDPEQARNRPRFEDLTPLFPDDRLHLEMPGEKENMTARIVDLLSPIGKGQRGLIVSPPKAGKTTVMKHIAHSIEANNPDVHLMVLLVDERPEEVTDMRRSVKGEVVASTFDRPSEEHTTVAELAIERAKRLVELGRDVVIILDGITRLARAYNLAHPATGRIMSGGVDSGALYPPKKFFGAARNIEEGGSLTILATALVETGSKMDEVIFEEFKGTGNMELRLDRRLAERRLYPSIDVNASSTRHEELLFDRSQLQQVWKLRRVLNALANEGSAAAGLELLMDKIRTTASNDEFLAEIAKGPAAP